METKRSWPESLIAVLELTATHRPELMMFQLEAIASSLKRPAMIDLAAAFRVPFAEVGSTVLAACRDLDRLEKSRGGWKDPQEVLESPNVLALYDVCEARIARVAAAGRRRRLEAMLRKLEKARSQVRTRIWIEDFIGARTAPADGKAAPEMTHPS